MKKIILIAFITFITQSAFSQDLERCKAIVEITAQAINNQSSDIFEQQLADDFDKMNKVNTLIVDKTGTITEGKPTVETIGSFGDAFSEKELLQFIVSLNTNSEHPLAEATVKYGKEHNVELIKSQDFSAVTGKGVEASIGVKKWH